jgi:membrane protease YdiL (CAAX protease family)
MQEASSTDARPCEEGGAFDWLRALLSVLAIVGAGYVAPALIVAYLVPSAQDLLSAGDMWANIAYEAISFGCCALVLLALGGGCLLRPRLGAIGRGLRSCAYMIAIDALTSAGSLVYDIANGYGFVSGWQTQLVLGFVFCLMVGLFEETCFRAVPLAGLLGPLGRIKGGIVGACVLTSVGFGLAHVLPADPSELTYLGVAQMVLKVVQTGLCGFLWAAVVIRDDDVWGVALGHCLTDYVVYVESLLYVENPLADVSYVSTSDAVAWDNIRVYLVLIVLYLPLVFIALRALKKAEVPAGGAFSLTAPRASVAPSSQQGDALAGRPAQPQEDLTSPADGGAAAGSGAGPRGGDGRPPAPDGWAG